MIREYKDMLLQIPRLKPRSKHMTLPEIVRYSRSNKIDDLISPSTVNKNIKSMSAVLSWAENNGYFDTVSNWSNPANKVRADESNKKPRLPFNDDDIKLIFDEDYNSLTDSKFWIPLISLYSGARLEEIGQLLISDIKKDKEFSFWYMDINEVEEGKRLKNKSATRLIPIHNKIIELGFLEYLGNSGRIFKDLNRKSSSDKLTPKVSKWFGGYRHKKGVVGTQKAFHSFRHLFKDVVRKQIANEELSDAITGHSNSSIGRKYGLGYGLEKLNEGVQSLQFDIGSVLKYDSRR
jgi:integrase